jgi:REP element-mobilizing transposase RayT
MWKGSKVERVQSGSIHVYIRGNNRHNVFYDDIDRIEFLNRCYFFAKSYDTQIQEFVLMDNHVHLQVETWQLSKFIRPFLISYVHWYNKKYNITAKLFQTPFNSVCKYSDSWKIDSMLYILQNPLKAEICEHPADYKWSSYNFHFNGKSSLRKYILLDTDLMDKYYKSKAELEKAVFQRRIKNMEIDEYQYKHFDKITNADLCKIIAELTEGKSVFKLNKNELESLIIQLNNETNASLVQIASITHENYDYVRNLCKKSE